MCEVSVRVAVGSNTLIDLEHVYACPWNVFFSEGSKHQPWRVPSADSNDETVAGGHGVARLRRDHRCSFPGDCIRVDKDFSSHASPPYINGLDSQAAGRYGMSAVSSVAAGLCQPPAGLSRLSASAGPQEWGSYS